MLANESRLLMPGDKVYWREDQNDKGEVQGVGTGGVLIAWDNGQRGWIDHRDMEQVNWSENAPESWVCDFDIVCPMCGGPVGGLGLLGNLAWYRCVDCGLDFADAVQ